MHRLIPVIEDGLDKYHDKLSKVRVAFFYFNLAIVFFDLHDYSSALKWINKLLNDSDIDSSQDIHCMGRILSMIIHLEIGHIDLLPYSIRSTQGICRSVKEFTNSKVCFFNLSINCRKPDLHPG